MVPVVAGSAVASAAVEEPGDVAYCSVSSSSDQAPLEEVVKLCLVAAGQAVVVAAVEVVFAVSWPLSEAAAEVPLVPVAVPVVPSWASECNDIFCRHFLPGVETGKYFYPPGSGYFSKFF